MAHSTMEVTRMELEGERFSSGIRRIDRSRDMCEQDVAIRAPFLNGKMLDVDVTSTRCWTIVVDHGDSSLVVDVYFSRIADGKAEIGQNGP